MEEEIELIDPTEAMRDDFIAYAEEFRAAREPFVHAELGRARSDFAGLIRSWRDEAAGRNLPDGYVPSTRYWLVRGGRILGTARLRHHLVPALEDFGGHIGYEVRPSERRCGYATHFLGEMLAKARQLGLRRVLVTCNNDNVASARVIQKNGGVLDSESYSPRSRCITQRYWIEL